MNLKKLSHALLVTAMIAFASTCLFSCHQKAKDMDRDEKLMILDAKIRKNPKDANLYYERGKVLLELERVNEAIYDLKRAVDLDNDEVEYHTALGDAYFMNGDMGNSHTSLQKALKLDPKNLEALLKMGEISFYSKDYDRAMETLSQVTAIDKDNRTAFFMKGYIYEETGDTANAIFYFRKVIDLYPDYEPAYEELGMLYAQHKSRLGVEYLTTAIQLEPNNVNALYGMAMLYQDLDEPDNATKYYSRILEIDPQNKYALHNRGYIEMVFYNDYEAAIRFFSMAIGADNQYIEAHTNRGYAYELKGDRNNAKICYQSALHIDPEFTLAKEGLDRVK